MHPKLLMSIESEIQQFLQDRFPDRRTEFNPNTALITTGLIDSFDILELLEFVEEKFRISLKSDELVQENFDSINALANLVAKKI